jgi:hypothetical protein
MGKRVLFVAHSPQAYDASGGRTRIVSVANMYKKNFNYHNYLICFFSLAKLFTIPKICEKKKRLANHISGKVLYVPLLPFSRFRLIYLINHFIEICIINLYSVLYRINIIHAHNHSAILSMQRLIIKKDLVADVHGSLFAESLYSGKEKIEILKKEEFEILKNVFNIVVVSEKQRKYYNDYFKEKKIKKNIIVIPCAIDLIEDDSFHLKNLMIQRKSEIDTNSQIKLCYSGSFRKYQCVNEIMEIWEMCRKLDIAFEFYIYTNHIDEFKTAINKYSELEKVTHVLSVPKEKIFTELLKMDIGMMFRENLPINNFASPTKCAEYLYAGLDIIGTKGIGDYSDMIDKNDLGLIVDNNSDYMEVLRKYLEQFHKLSYEDRLERKLTNQNFVKQNFSWVQMSKIYAPLLK